MKKPLPAPPVDSRIATLPDTIGGRYSALKQICAQMHRMGDIAAASERGAQNRREQRRLQSVNKHARAAAQAVEASIWLGAVVDRDATARGASKAARDALLLRVSQDAILLTDDLVFEAAVIGAYNAEPSPAMKRKP